MWFGARDFNPLSMGEDAAAQRRIMRQTFVDMLALGTCDVLFVPNYSSFTYIPLARTAMRGARTCLAAWQFPRRASMGRRF